MWRQSVQPGAWACYHRGYLDRDRIANKQLDARAWVAMNLYESGQILLAQRKLSNGEGFEYWAIAGNFEPPRPKLMRR
jgi:hypothetical protein